MKRLLTIQHALHEHFYTKILPESMRVDHTDPPVKYRQVLHCLSESCAC